MPNSRLFGNEKQKARIAEKERRREERRERRRQKGDRKRSYEVCLEKKQYATPEEAAKAVCWMFYRFPETAKISVYQCCHCKKFHLTNKLSTGNRAKFRMTREEWRKAIKTGSLLKRIEDDLRR